MEIRKVNEDITKIYRIMNTHNCGKAIRTGISCDLTGTASSALVARGDLDANTSFPNFTVFLTGMTRKGFCEELASLEFMWERRLGKTDGRRVR